MRDESTSNVPDESAASFIEHEIGRAKSNLQCAVSKLGQAALRVANPVAWFRRYPVKCSLVTGAVLASGAAAAVLLIRRHKGRDDGQGAQPIQVYVKSTKAKPKGLGAQLVSALIAGLSAKATQAARNAIINAMSSEQLHACRTQTVIVPNPKLRDVQI